MNSLDPVTLPTALAAVALVKLSTPIVPIIFRAVDRQLARITWLQPCLRTAECSAEPNTAVAQSVPPSWAVLTKEPPAVNVAGNNWPRASGAGSSARVSMCCHWPKLFDGLLAGEAAAGEPAAPDAAGVCLPGWFMTAIAATAATAGTQMPVTTTRLRVRPFRLAALRALAAAARDRPATVLISDRASAATGSSTPVMTGSSTACVVTSMKSAARYSTSSSEYPARSSAYGSSACGACPPECRTRSRGRWAGSPGRSASATPPPGGPAAGGAPASPVSAHVGAAAISASSGALDGAAGSFHAENWSC